MRTGIGGAEAGSGERDSVRGAGLGPPDGVNGEEKPMTEENSGVETHTVRPRWTWIALLVMVAGLVLIAVAVIMESWTWAVPGLVVLAVGAGAALYGGVFFRVPGGGPPPPQRRGRR